ncbi:MAG: hypothetical protein WCT37_05155 [Patescibacteria group bacterium]|jgi:hypothetical protein
MKSQNLLLLSGKFIAKDIVGNVLYWPVWWYSAGLAIFVKERWQSLRDFEGEVGLTVWIVNWFKPMYGESDLVGKAISFVMRTVMIVFKAWQIALYFFCQVAVVAIWLLLPPVAVWQVVKGLI